MYAWDTSPVSYWLEGLVSPPPTTQTTVTDLITYQNKMIRSHGRRQNTLVIEHKASIKLGRSWKLLPCWQAMFHSTGKHWGR